MCIADDCSRSVKALNLCNKHYARFRKHGSYSDDFGIPDTVLGRFQKIGWKVIDECFIWNGTKNTDGYGSFRLDGTMQGAHRVSYSLFVGTIPEGMAIRHTCDNPPCMNPDHLITGSQLDNIVDCMNRGRRSKQDGENNHARKLDWKSVTEIRKIYEQGGRSQQSIADEYGVSQLNISKIVRNKTWVVDNASPS